MAPTPRRTGRGWRVRAADDAGTGVVGTLVGVTVFLTLLLFATQLALNLYAASTVTAAAFDGARIVAGSEAGGEPAACRDAEEHVRSLLGDLEVRFAWSVGADDVALTVVAERGTSLLRGLAVPFDTVERTVRIRREAFR